MTEREIKELDEAVGAAARVDKYAHAHCKEMSISFLSDVYNVWNALEKLLTEKEEAADD